MNENTTPHLQPDLTDAGDPVQVLLYGRDPALLSYRNQVVRLAGFKTKAVELSGKRSMSTPWSKALPGPTA
jgi:hypothetical protein